ncbi:SIMPL domain-containing protein [Rufibacter ruber]|uniref:SIMPL domain-containing protein n=1 Tax=Rufibacter ruber TaxID=1783499 RepID=UPI00082CCBBB|nr:SIMPL domain-containing protein [Rufibacter ruber]
MNVFSSTFSRLKMKLAVLYLLAIPLLTACNPPAAVEKKQVKVLGHGSVTSYPDYAEISVESSFTKDRMKDAVKEVLVVTNEVMALAKKFTNAPEDVRVSSISANKDYEYANGKQKFLGYNSAQSITVKISDLKKLEAFMEELLTLRINRIQNISYSHTKADSLRREASALALADATKAADQLCQASNAKRGAVLEVANYRTLETEDREVYAQQEVNMGLYGKGFGGEGFKITLELLRFKGTCHVVFEIE